MAIRTKLNACQYFDFNSYEDMLREEVREDLKWNVERSSAADKIRDFTQRSRCDGLLS
jgi:hypothetical protein